MRISRKYMSNVRDAVERIWSRHPSRSGFWIIMALWPAWLVPSQIWVLIGKELHLLNLGENIQAYMESRTCNSMYMIYVRVLPDLMNCHLKTFWMHSMCVMLEWENLCHYFFTAFIWHNSNLYDFLYKKYICISSVAKKKLMLSLLYVCRICDKRGMKEDVFFQWLLALELYMPQKRQCNHGYSSTLYMCLVYCMAEPNYNCSRFWLLWKWNASITCIDTVFW